MTHNLKACPFCGGRPYIESHSRGFVKGVSCRVAYVRCTECNTRTERFPISMGPAEAVKAAVNRLVKVVRAARFSSRFTLGPVH